MGVQLPLARIGLPLQPQHAKEKCACHVLDVGSGGGIDAIFMAQQGLRVAGIDISAAALKIAQKRAKKAHVKVDWLRGSVLELPINGETIDFITDRGLFHLTENHDRPSMLRKFSEYLKKGGHALIRGAAANHPTTNSTQWQKKPSTNISPASQFKRGPVLPIPLLSVEGAMDARIVMLQKTGHR